MIHEDEKVKPIKVQPGLPDFDVSNSGMSKDLLVKDELINSSSESESFEGTPT